MKPEQRRSRFVRGVLYGFVLLLALAGTGVRAEYEPIVDVLDDTQFRVEVWDQNAAPGAPGRPLRNPRNDGVDPYAFRPFTSVVQGYDLDANDDGTNDLSVNLGVGTTTAAGPKIEIWRLRPQPGTGPGVVRVPQPVVRVAVVFYLKDATTNVRTKEIRWGYDARKSGASLPPVFRTTVSSVSPLAVEMSTLSETKLAGDVNHKPTYAGPLGLYLHVNDLLDVSTTELDLTYRPLPDNVRVQYVTAGERKTVHYGHGRTGDGVSQPADLEKVDLQARLHTTASERADRAQSEVIADARVRDLPPSFTASFLTGGVRGQYSSGDLSYQAPAAINIGDGVVRGAPDVRPGITASVWSRSNSAPHGAPQVFTISEVDARVEDFANTLAANWYLPVDPGCKQVTDRANPCKPVFVADAGTDPLVNDQIGVVEFNAESRPEAVAPIAPFRASKRDYVNVQMTTEGATRVSGRIHGLRYAEYRGRPRGHYARVDAGEAETPLQVHVDVDRRQPEPHRVSKDTTLTQVDAVADPLPRDVEFTFDAQEGTAPLTLDFKQLGSTPKEFSVDAVVGLAETVSGIPINADTCATSGITCAKVNADRVGKQVTAKVFDNAARTDVDIEHVPAGANGAQTRVVAHVDSFSKGKPTIADVDVLGVPRYLRARIAKDAEGTPTSVAFDTCLVDGQACVPGTEGTIGDIAFAVRNLKKDTLPVPRANAKHFLAMVVRGNEGTDTSYRASGRLVNVDRLRFTDDGRVQGLHANAGGGKSFAVVLQKENVLKDVLKPEEGRQDVASRIAVGALPTDFKLCVRLDGKAPNGSTQLPYTVRCEKTDVAKNLTETDAISLGYEANARFTVNGTVETRDRTDDTRVTANMTVPEPGVPNAFELHLVTPSEKANRTQTRAVLSSAAAAGGLASLTLDAKVLKGDSICQDPRATAVATCVSTTLHNLPREADVFFDDKVELDTACAQDETDPTKRTFNLCVRAFGDPAKPTSLSPFSLSMVRPYRNDDGQVVPGRSSVMRVKTPGLVIATEGTQGGELMGDIFLPDKGDIDPAKIEFEAVPKLDLDVELMTYVDGYGPKVAVPNRMDGDTVVRADADLMVVGRGGANHARVKLNGLKKIGFTSRKSSDGKPLPTRVVSADFESQKDNLRVYADVQGEQELSGGVFQPGDHTVLDVLLKPLPKSFVLCVRPEPDKRKAADPTWCDQPTGDGRTDELAEEGSVQIATEATQKLDVDAFLRLRRPDQTVLASRIRFDDVAPLIRVRFPLGKAGDLGINGYTPTEAMTAHQLAALPHDSAKLAKSVVGTVAVLAKSHDLGLAELPYKKTELPYEEKPGDTPGVAPATEERFGVRTGSGQLGLDFRVKHLKAFLAASTGAFDRDCKRPDGLLQRPSDPHYPANVAAIDANPYLCIRGEFARPAHESNPLGLDIVHDDGIEHLSLRNVKLDNIPNAFAVTLAQVDTLKADGTFRPSCGTVTAPGPEGCAPALLHLSLPGAGRLEGMIGYGPSAHVRRLDTLSVPGVPNLVVDPKTGWTEWGFGRTGIRAKVGVVTVDGELMPSLLAGIRLNVPSGFTLDQINSWTKNEIDTEDKNKEVLWKASDIGLHYRLARADGSLENDLGQLMAWVLLSDQKRRLATVTPPPPPENPNEPVEKPRRRGEDLPDDDWNRPKTVTKVDRTENLLVVTGTDPEGKYGIEVPGEMEARIYLRSHKKRSQDFVQIEGKGTRDIDARVRLVPVPGAKSSVGPIALDATLLDLPMTPAAGAGPNDPAFRVVAEIRTAKESGGPSCKPFGDDEFCAEAQLKIDTKLDLDPRDEGNPARRVEAVILGHKAFNGVEVESYANVDPNDSTYRPVGVEANVAIDPLKLSARASVPSVGADINLDLTIATSIKAPYASNWAFRHEGVRLHLVNYQRSGRDEAIRLGPTTMHARRLDGQVILGIPLFAIETIGLPKNLGYEWEDCDSGFEADRGATITVQPGAQQGLLPNAARDNGVVLIPYVPSIALAGLSYVTSGWVYHEQVACKDPNPTRLALIHENGSPDAGRTQHPAVPTPVIPGHDVPGARQGAWTAPAPVQRTPSSGVDFAPGTSIKLCGLHVYDELTVPSGVTIEVSTDTDDTSTTGDGLPNCAEGDRGRLLLVTRKTTIASGGVIDANGKSLDVGNATGNSGGSHINAGGFGNAWSFNVPSAPFGDKHQWSRETEPGHHGASPGSGAGAGGAGGGAVKMIATELVQVDGTVTANGLNGADGCPTGTFGAGGGAGGGISIDAPRVGGAGQLVANGGQGGTGRRPDTEEARNGAGAGGAGGTVKVYHSLGTAPGVSTAGGPGGQACHDGNVRANPGRAGYQRVAKAPRSRIEQPEKFWTNQRKLKAAFSVAVEGGDTRPYWIAFCGYDKTPEQIRLRPEGEPLVGAFRRNFVFGPQGVCGPFGRQLGELEFSGELVNYNPETQQPHVMLDVSRENYWGVWTRVIIPPEGHVPGECGDVECEYEPVTRDFADAVFGVDQSPPAVKIVAPEDSSAVTRYERVPLEIETGDQVGMSGVAKVECQFRQGEPYEPCPPTWDLRRSGEFDNEGNLKDGEMRIEVRATDHAGAQGYGVRFIRLDTQAPDSVATVGGIEVPIDGWYRVPPQVTIKVQGQPQLPPPGQPNYAYRIDGGTERVCNSHPCVVDMAVAGTGAHRLEFAAYDAAGNRHEFGDDCPPERCVIVKIDGQSPEKIEPRVVGTMGNNGWYTTAKLTFATIDQIGGSGPGPIQWAVKDAEGQLGPWQAYDPKNPPDIHGYLGEVCWKGADAAGNPYPKAGGHECGAVNVRADRIAPALQVNLQGTEHTASKPFGENVRVFTSVVTPEFAVTDEHSKVVPGYDNQADLCGPLPPAPTEADPKTPSGVCVSVDGTDFVPATALTLGAGRHEILAYAVDVAGNRSATVRELLVVDNQAPGVDGEYIPGRADAADGTFRVGPAASLRVGDGRDGVGVGADGVVYRIDATGEWLVYTGPVDLPAGRHFVEYAAKDTLGNLSAARRTPTVTVDGVGPVVTIDGHTKTRETTGFERHTLTYSVRDSLAAGVHHSAAMPLRVVVLTFDHRHNLVQREVRTGVSAPAGGAAGTYTATFDTTNVTDSGPTNIDYYFRVLVADPSGNWSQSQESGLA